MSSQALEKIVREQAVFAQAAAFKKWYLETDDKDVLSEYRYDACEAAFEAGIEYATLKLLEQRCERKTVWDIALLTAYEAIRGIKLKE